MKVEILHITPLEILIKAIRKCYESEERSDSFYLYDKQGYEKKEYVLGPKDKELIQKVIKLDHTSTLEHIIINYELSGYSRALLQEKSRTRHASVSEKSTRYCLKQLKTAPVFYDSIKKYNVDEAKKYIIFTGEEQVDRASIQALENLRQCVVAGIPNDKTKFCLPDSLQSTCIFSINLRSLQNLLKTRTAPSALWEYRKLAYKMYDIIPEEYKFILSGFVYKENDN